MFTITADKARYYSERPWIDNVVEIDLENCLDAVLTASGKGRREVDVDAPSPESQFWGTGNNERIDRVIDELRDRGFCVKHKCDTSDGGSRYMYHIEW